MNSCITQNTASLALITQNTQDAVLWTQINQITELRLQCFLVLEKFKNFIWNEFFDIVSKNQNMTSIVISQTLLACSTVILQTSAPFAIESRDERELQSSTQNKTFNII